MFCRWRFSYPIAALFAETLQKYRNVCYEKKVQTVMVNNSFNINKTNNLLSPSHWTQKRPQNLTLEIQVLA
jgi:hypothetical protein